MAKVPTTRRCCKCGRDLPFEEFRFIKNRMMYDYYCRDCTRAMNRKYYWQRKNGVHTMTPRYSDEDIQYLLDHYKTDSYADIAEKLGRSYSSVALKINKLGLKKK